MQTLKGRTCVFAGAAGGDGAYCVKELCQAGMNVIMFTHSPDQAIELKKEIDSFNYEGKCDYYVQKGDVAAECNVDYYEDIMAKYGSIDVVVCNIGGPGRKDSIDTLTEERLSRMLDHLVVGSFAMMKTALPYLRKSKAARVIFMSTCEGIHGGTYESYSDAVARGAIQSLTLNTASRLAKEGITVNCIAKGPIDKYKNIDDTIVAPSSIVPKVPMGRIGTCEEVAHTVTFLASEESSYITGQIIELSGGMQLGI